jgi:hypothetical protein
MIKIPTFAHIIKKNNVIPVSKTLNLSLQTFMEIHMVTTGSCVTGYKTKLPYFNS